ncbi:MAG: adenylyl-sulfate kinase [Actinomycetota bacterium]|nr:adenylyl-sulfate kinase [Actinomycetota bacterium]
MPEERKLPVPQWTPTARELDDLELLGTGILPLDGFTGPDGVRPVPAITLTVPRQTADSARTAGVVELLDPEGLPLARLSVTSTYDTADGVGLVGPVATLHPPQFGPFRRYVRPAADVDVANSFAVPVDAPLTDQALRRIAEVAIDTGCTPVLVVYTGAGSPQGVSGPGLLRATLAAAGGLDAAQVVSIPVARRDPGGPDTDADRWLRDRVAQAYGRSVMHPATGGTLPDRVAAVVARDRPPKQRRGLVVFFTGLSGSGKSTIARALSDALLERGDRTVTSLDGDVVRHHLSKGLGFSREDRETNIARIGWVAAEISRHGGLAICSPIAPFDATRRLVRGMAQDAGGGFVLVHVATPVEECERRDRKGLYAKARAGLIPDFTGISSPYEAPADADLAIDTTGREVGACVEEVLDLLSHAGWLGTPTLPTNGV